MVFPGIFAKKKEDKEIIQKIFLIFINSIYEYDFGVFSIKLLILYKINLWKIDQVQLFSKKL